MGKPVDDLVSDIEAQQEMEYLERRLGEAANKEIEDIEPIILSEEELEAQRKKRKVVHEAFEREHPHLFDQS